MARIGQDLGNSVPAKTRLLGIDRCLSGALGTSAAPLQHGLEASIPGGGFYRKDLPFEYFEQHDPCRYCRVH